MTSLHLENKQACGATCHNIVRLFSHACPISLIRHTSVCSKNSNLLLGISIDINTSSYMKYQSFYEKKCTYLITFYLIVFLSILSKLKIYTSWAYVQTKLYKTVIKLRSFERNELPFKFVDDSLTFECLKHVTDAT